MELCAGKRGTQLHYSYLSAPSSALAPSSAASSDEAPALRSETVSNARAILKYQIPLSEVVTDFFDQLKSLSSGFASLDYEDGGWEESDSVKINLHINGNPIGSSDHCYYSQRSRPD